MAGRLREAAMKTPKQVEAIENTLIDTIAKLTEDGTRRSTFWKPCWDYRVHPL
jgi:hypothetical protein